MSKKTALPAWIGPSRAWKQRKRREFAALEAALKVFNFGCAYTPIYQDFLECRCRLEALKKSLSQKEWGR